MNEINLLTDRLIALIGEETLYRELEGILHKHEGIARRTRKPGRVALCGITLRDYGDEEITPRMFAQVALTHSLSPASTYRLVRDFRSRGSRIRAVDVLREMHRMKSGVY